MSQTPESNGWQAATVAIARGRPPRTPGGPLNVPPVLATTFYAGSERNYARDNGTPTWEAFEDVVGALESGHAVAFSSGMAAVAATFATAAFTALAIPSVGYAGTRRYAEEYAAARKIACAMVDVTDTAAMLRACVPGALLWVESPTNPELDVADVSALIAGGHERGAVVVVDNTFATPLLQRPLALGADYSVHSGTKYLAGHSDATIGVVIAAAAENAARLRHVREVAGAIPGALETYLALRGIRTLPLRFERAQANARELAARLGAHASVERVRYPGSGAMVSFEVRGGEAAANRVCEATQLISHATSLGGVETCVERRAKYPGEAYLPGGFIRMTVGCENVDDLWADLARALS